MKWMVFAACCGLSGMSSAQQSPLYRGLATDVDEVQATVIVDFDRDGVLDVVAAVDGDGGPCLQRLRGGGVGGVFPFFGPIETGASGDVFRDLEVGDLDGDGLSDVVGTVLSNGFGELHVSLGGGVSGFDPFLNLPLGGNSPRHVELTDADGDGNLDALVMSLVSLRLFVGRGDGTFEPGQVIPTSVGTEMLHVADLDGDGDDDLVIADTFEDEIEVLTANGDGTYTTAQVIATPTPRDVTSGDYDGDGDLDLATASGEGLTILRRGAAGAYGDLTVLPYSGTWRVETGDYDSDGKPDLVAQLGTGPLFGSDTFVVFGGAGDFTFAPIALEDVPYGIVSIEPALLNGDLELDWVVTHGIDAQQLDVRTVQIALGRPDDASLFAGQSGGTGIQEVILADLDGDGFDDRIAHRGNSGPFVSLSNGFGLGVSVSAGGQGDYDGFAAGDVDADGALDVVLGKVGSFTLETFVGVGDGSLTGPVVSDFSVTGVDVVDIELGDLDGDGAADAVALVDDGVGDAFLAPLASDGAGGFTAGPPIVEPGRSLVIALGDLDGDGALDLVDVTADLLRVRRGVPGSLSFEPPFEVALPADEWVEVLITELPGDGVGDVLLAGTSGIRTLNGQVGPLGELSLTLVPFFLVEGVSDMALYDATDDGLPDLVASDAEGYETRVYRGRIDGAAGFGFELAQRVPTRAVRVAAGRIDGPEFDDFVAVSTGRSTVHLRERPWPWISIGGGGAPAGVEAPSLRGSGDPLPGEPITFLFEGGRPNAPAILAIGLAENIGPNPPTVSGIELIPTLDLLVPLPPADADGDIRLDTIWTNFPPGIELWNQVWQVAPFDVRASPGLFVESR